MDQQQTIERPAAAANEEIEIDLLDLFSYYLSKLPILIVAILIGAILSGLYTVRFIPKRYTAVSRMYMISASSDSVVDLSDLNIGASLSNDYVELMKSRPIINGVIQSLGLEYTYDQLIQMISLSVVSNTRIIRISVTSTDPEEAMMIANQMARTAKAQLPVVMDAPSPSIAEEAVLPTVKSSPSLSRNVLMGALLCLVAVLGVLTFLYMMDDTIKTPEDLEKEFGFMPMTVIPEGNIEGMIKTADEEKRSLFGRKKKKTKTKAKTKKSKKGAA